MKTLALSAAVLSLSAGWVLADCGSHTTSAAVNVDRQMTTASIASDAQASTDVVLIKQKRLPADEPVSTE